jgi:hypothetical protein
VSTVLLFLALLPLLVARVVRAGVRPRATGRCGIAPRSSSISLPMATRSTREFLQEAQTRVATRVKSLRPRPERPHLLEVIEGPGTGTRFRLEGPAYKLGRGAQADLQLDSEEVSRSHARLTRADGEYTIEDLGSRNGILLNGIRVHAAVLRDGDELQLGDVTLKYLEGT